MKSAPRLRNLYFGKPSFLFGSLLVLSFATLPSKLSCQQFTTEKVNTSARESTLRFSVASIRPSAPNAPGWKMEFTPNGFTARNVTLNTMIMEAWNSYAPGSLVGGPKWIDNSRYDVEAKLDTEDIPQFRDLDLPARRRMLQELLKDRFQVQMHTERREIPALILTRVRTGPDLQPAKSQSYAGSVPGYDSLVTKSGPGELEGKSFSIPSLANLLQNYTGHVVQDDTHMTGRYDFSLHWSSQDTSPAIADLSEDANGPSLFTALREQLGLKLELRKVPGDVSVVDSAGTPTGN
jgi:uncharacterized protein (TIGR03435 family)